MHSTQPCPSLFIARCLAWYALVLLLCWPAAATARQPIQPPAWFIQSVVADPVALPSGLRLRQMHEGFELVNLATPPVFVLAPTQRSVDMPPPVPIAPPAGWIASDKLAEGRAFFWGWEDQPQRWNWFTEGDVTSFNLVPSNLIKYAPTIAQPVRLGDDRPPNVPIPPPQPAILMLMDEQHIIQLPFTLQHDLNPNYDQEVQVYRLIIAEQQWQQYGMNAVIALVVLLGAGLAIALLVRVVHMLTYRPGPTRQ